MYIFSAFLFNSVFYLILYSYVLLSTSLWLTLSAAVLLNLISSYPIWSFLILSHLIFHLFHLISLLSQITILLNISDLPENEIKKHAFNDMTHLFIISTLEFVWIERLPAPLKMTISRGGMEARLINAEALSHLSLLGCVPEALRGHLPFSKSLCLSIEAPPSFLSSSPSVFLSQTARFLPLYVCSSVLMAQTTYLGSNPPTPPPPISVLRWNHLLKTRDHTLTTVIGAKGGMSRTATTEEKE